MRDWAAALLRLLRLSYRAAGHQVTVYAVLAIVLEAGLLLGLWGVRELVDAVSSGKHSEIWHRAAVVAGVGYFSTLVGKSQFHRATKIIEKSSRSLDEELMRLIGGAEGIEHHESPELMDEVAVVADERSNAASACYLAVTAMRSTLQLAGGVWLLTRMHAHLVILPIFGVCSLILHARAQRGLAAVTLRTADGLRQSQELVDLATRISAGMEIRLFGLGDEISRRYNLVTTERRTSRNHANLQAALIRAAGRMIFAAGYIGATAIVLREALEGRATPGDLVLALTLAAAINGRIIQTADEVAALSRAVRTGRYLISLELVLLPPARVDPSRRSTKPVPDRITDGIQVEHLSFEYPGTSVEVLHDVSFSLRAGSVIALLGDNGSGKTSLIKLLTGMYRPTDGRISVDGIGIDEFDTALWRSATSCLLQDYSRFHFILRESVGLGDLQTIRNNDIVAQALQDADATEMVSGLPYGSDTQLGAAWSGVELSAGQWQKLALARSLMRPSPLLLICDEPSAALDPLSEQMLFSRLAQRARMNRMNGSITLLVSHRFSTALTADLIVLLQAGRIVELGSPEELLKEDGLYAELFALQARAYS